MVLKLLVVMVAVSALEGVFGLPDKQLVNGTQSKAKVGHGKSQRGSRLDKLACQIFHGNCQRLEDGCDGVLEEGPNWCLHSRHFGCCIQRSDTLGCTLNFRTYRDGATAEEMCIILICRNGEWFYYDVNPKCGLTCIYGTTIMPFVDHPPLHGEYNITGSTAVYSLTQTGFTSDPFSGVDIYIVDGLIECIVVYCKGLTVEICCSIEGSYPWVWVDGHWISPRPFGKLIPLGWCVDCPVFMIWQSSSMYFFFPDFTVCINWDPDYPRWAFSVYVLATTSLYGKLYGLSGVWVPPPPPPYPGFGIMQGGGETDDLDAFITSWQLPHRRSRIKHHRENPSSDQTGQVIVRPKIERSMTDIVKICEEMNKDLCTILPSEKCEKIMDYCMSSMSGLSDSSE